MPESCGRVTIPGDPEAIHAAARGLEEDADRAEEEIFGQIRRARELALAGWSGPAADEFEAFISRASTFEAEKIDAERAAARIWHDYAYDLARAQAHLGYAVEDEQAAERGLDSAEPRSNAESAARDALRNAREDQLKAAAEAAEAEERASLAMERLIGGLPRVPAPPGGGAGEGDFDLDYPETLPLEALGGGLQGLRGREKNRIEDLERKTNPSRADRTDLWRAKNTSKALQHFGRRLPVLGAGVDYAINREKHGPRESAGRAGISAGAGILFGGLAGAACGAISFGLLAAACGVGFGAAGSALGNEVGDIVYGED